MGFKEAFKNNYYLSEEFAKFCSVVSGKKLSKEGKYFVVGSKSVGIHSYTDGQKEKFRQKKIRYMSVLNEVNDSSFTEYSIILKGSYEELYTNYKKSFKGHLKKVSPKLKLKIVKKYNQKVYPLYLQKVWQKNSMGFTEEFFQEYMKLKNSLLFLVYYGSKIVGFTFGFENEENLYLSIGGEDSVYYKHKVGHFSYDQFVKYACSKGLNIHLGMGEKGSGYNKFKANIGAIHYKCERYPNDEWMIKLLFPLMKFRIVGWINKRLGILFPKKFVYEVIPFA